MMLSDFLSGAVFFAALAGSVFFLKFWRKTRDSLFAMFSLAFFLLGIERIAHAPNSSNEADVYVYLIRLAAYIVILIGIVNKNRGAR